jgi:hypothetical protein
MADYVKLGVLINIFSTYKDVRGVVLDPHAKRAHRILASWSEGTAWRKSEMNPSLLLQIA